MTLIFRSHPNEGGIDHPLYPIVSEVEKGTLVRKNTERELDSPERWTRCERLWAYDPLWNRWDDPRWETNPRSGGAQIHYLD